MKVPREAIIAIVLFFVTLGVLFGWYYWPTSSFDRRIRTQYKNLLSQAGAGPCDYAPLGNPETEAQKVARECAQQVCQHNLDNPGDDWTGWACACKADCVAGNQAACDAIDGGPLTSFICNPCLIPPEHPAGYGKKGTSACTSSSSTSSSSSSSSSSSEAHCGGLLGVCSGSCKNGNQCLPNDQNECSCCPSGQVERSDGSCACPLNTAQGKRFRRWFGWILGAQVQEPPCPKPNVCGNGAVEGLEQCDDGNQNDKDGCNNNCEGCTNNSGAGCCSSVLYDDKNNFKEDAGRRGPGEVCGELLCVDCINQKCNSGLFSYCAKCSDNDCNEIKKECDDCKDKNCDSCKRYQACLDEVKRDQASGDCIGNDGKPITENLVCAGVGDGPKHCSYGFEGDVSGSGPGGGGPGMTGGPGGNGDSAGDPGGDPGTTGSDNGSGGGSSSTQSRTTATPNPCRLVGGLPAGGEYRCTGECSEGLTCGEVRNTRGVLAGCQCTWEWNGVCHRDPETHACVGSCGAGECKSDIEIPVSWSKNPSYSPDGCYCAQPPISSSSSVSSSPTGECHESIGANGVRQCGGTCPARQVCGFWGDGNGPNVCGCKSFTGNGSSSSNSGGSSGTSASSVSTTSSSSSSRISVGSCGWNGQQCGGSCPSGTSCKLDGAGGSPNCVCATTSGTCGFNGSQCGGTCQSGSVCKEIDAGCQCVVNPGQRCNPINNICGGSCPANQVCAQVTKELSLAQCTLETMGEECTTTHGERGVCGFAAGNYLTFECTRQDLPCRTYSSVGDVCTSNDEDGTCQRLGHSTELVCVKNKDLTSAEWQDRPFDRPFCGCIPAGGSSGGTAGNAGNAGTISGGGSTAQIAGSPAGSTGSSSGGSSGTSSVQSTSSSSGGSSGISSRSSQGNTSSSSSGGGSSQSSRSGSSSSSSGSSGTSSTSSRGTSSSSSGGSARSSTSSSRLSSSSSSRSGGSSESSSGNLRCGDGIKQLSEQCDTGTLNRDTPNSCRTSCRLPACGDKIVDTGEQCDDGNTNNTDFCTTTCTFAIASGGFCGDSILQTSRGEQCDNGSRNSFLPNQCRPTCVLPICGDSTKDSGEQCDDGNLIQHDGCSNFCLLERSIPTSSAHPAPTTGGTGYISGQVAGGISGAAGQVSGQFAGNATAGTVGGQPGGAHETAGNISGQTAGGSAGYTAGNLGGGYSTGAVGGYTAGNLAGGTASGNPWGGSMLPHSIPPATQTQTGPGLVILIATGAAAGVGYVRRRRK